MNIHSILREIFSSYSPPNKPSILPLRDKRNYRNWNMNFQVNKTFGKTKFIHIGKCGGTSILYHFASNRIELEEYHLVRPIPDPTEWYFLWVRNPIKRFVSSFNHAKAIIDFETNDELSPFYTLDNCPAPSRLIESTGRDYIFSPDYDELVKSFDNANELAESITSPTPRLKERAACLMHHEQEHIYKGIGWYLDNGAFVERHHKRIIFTGRLEFISEDLINLLTLIGTDTTLLNSTIKHTRVGKETYSKYLSNKSIKNIINFYQHTDYKALNELKRKKFLRQEDLDAYYTY